MTICPHSLRKIKNLIAVEVGLRLLLHIVGSALEAAQCPACLRLPAVLACCRVEFYLPDIHIVLILQLYATRHCLLFLGTGKAHRGIILPVALWQGGINNLVLLSIGRCNVGHNGIPGL